MASDDFLPSATPFRLRVYINAGRFGWSECYWLHTSQVDEALAWSADLCNRRRLWFGGGVRTEYASVSRGLRALDTWAVNVEQLSTFPPWTGAPEPPNDAQSGLLYRLNSPGGHYQPRLLKGVPDDWLRDVRQAFYLADLVPLGELPLPHVPLLAAPPGQQAPLAPMSLLQLRVLQRSFLDALLLYTGWLIKGPTPNDPATWTVGRNTQAYPRGESNRPSKHEWRRVSWTPRFSGLAAPTGVSWFSPCGVVMGVARTTYSKACVFYNDTLAPAGKIWFYYSGPEAAVFYGPNRFGPKISEPGYFYFGGAGELNLGGRPWNDGTGVPPNPGGVVISGPAPAFAGQEPYPPNYASGLLIPPLASCDLAPQDECYILLEDGRKVRKEVGAGDFLLEHC